MTLDVVSGLLILLALADWWATVILVRAALAIREAAIEERATTAVILTLGATATAFLAAVRLLRIDILPGLGTALLIAALVAVSVPQLIWAVAYWRGQFR